MLIRRAYDKGASFLSLFHTVKETDWRLTDTEKGRRVVQDAIDSGAKIRLASSLDKNPDGELVSGESHRSFSLPVAPGERYTMSRSETSNNRFVYAFTGETPRAGAKFVAPAGSSSELNDRLAIAGVRVPKGASHMVLHLSSQGDEIPRIMLEKGNRPSDWRPAPEETAGQTTATTVNNGVTAIFVKTGNMVAVTRYGGYWGDVIAPTGYRPARQALCISPRDSSGSDFVTVTVKPDGAVTQSPLSGSVDGATITYVLI